MMDSHDRNRFQAIQVPFAERVDSIEMLGYITCLPEHTRDTIRNSQTAHNGSKLLAAQTLFAALKCRPDGLQQAAYALRKCGHDDLADKIDPQQDSQQIREGVYQLLPHPYDQQGPATAVNVPSAHSVSFFEFQNYSQGDKALQNFGGKESSIGKFQTVMSVQTNLSTGIEQKNDLNKSDSENEDSDSDFRVNKNIEKEENISSVPDSDSNKIINNQDNAEFRQSLTNTENLSVNPHATGFDSSETMLKGIVKNIDNNATRTGFDSSETTLKSPITDDENKELSLRSEAVKNNFETEITQENVENIRQECFSDVYSHTASPLPSTPELSTGRTANVEAAQQPVDQSLEDARIPEMRCLRDNDEIDSIKRKGDKANASGIIIYNRVEGAEDGESNVSYSEESGSAVNSVEDMISMDAIPTTEGNTVGADINGMNEYFAQVNLNGHPTNLTKDQTKNNNVQKSKTDTSKGADANNQTDNQQERGGVSKSDGNRIPSIQCPSVDTSAQFACEYRVFDDIGQRPEAAEYVRADNSTDERLTSWISLGSSLASFTYKVLHPDV